MTRRTCARFVLALLFVCLLAYHNANTKVRHLGGESCNDCHLSSGVVEPESAHNLIATQEELCSGCHVNATVASHPSGVIPSMQTPGEYPLDWKGELTCSTCHEVHGARQGLLRTDLQGRGYCLSCHKKDFFNNMHDMIATGHLSAVPSTPSFSGTMDSFSLQCLDCHANDDGLMFVSLNMQGVVNHNSSKGNHPIGRDYKKAELFGGYRRAESLPDYIALPDGMVSCISCHQAYSSSHGKLVESNDGSQLCFRCHDL